MVFPIFTVARCNFSQPSFLSSTQLHLRTYSRCVPRRRETSLAMIFATIKRLLSSRNRQGRICRQVLPASMDNDLMRLNLNRQLIVFKQFQVNHAMLIVREIPRDRFFRSRNNRHKVNICSG